MELTKLARSASPALFLFVMLVANACQGEAGTGVGPVLNTPTFDGAQAWAHLEHQVNIGPRPAGSPGSKMTRDWLVSELESYGMKVTREAFVAQTPKGEIPMENIYADLPGPAGPKGIPGPMIVLGSHFDTKALPFEFVGANDGASNTAVLLQIAKTLAAAPKAPVTYRFLFFDGEEALRFDWRDPDNRYGSTYHVKQLDKVKGARKRIRAMILIDMVGDKDLVLEYDSSSTRQLLELFVKTSKSIGDAKLFSTSAYPIEDDHEPFIQQGIPSVDLIDLHYGKVANEYWHTAQDTIEHCSQESLQRVGDLVLATLPKVIETYVR